MAPSPEKVKLVGAVAVQPVAVAAGAVALSVIRKPVTPTASLALSPVTDTVNDVEVVGRVKVPTVGATTSGRVMVVEAERLLEMLPAASLAQA